MEQLDIGRPQPGPTSAGGGRNPDYSIWRQWYIRLSWTTIPIFAAIVIVAGVALIVLRNRLSSHQDGRSLAMEIGVNLVMFGTATMLITVIASVQLEHKLLGRFSDRMDDHVDEVRTTMAGVQQEFTKTINGFVPLLGNCADYGLVNVYLTRADALKDFGKHLTEELKEAAAAPVQTNADPGTGGGAAGDQKPQKARLWIAASSMKGILETATGGFDGTGILEWAAEVASKDLLDLHILLTHPQFASVRAGQEHRGSGAIDEEIAEALRFMQRRNVPMDCVKLARATPTVFAVATRHHMLLNPYPYGVEAYRSFTLTVKRVHLAPNDHPALHRDIFEQYEHRHFIVPWDDALELSPGFTIPSVAEGPTPPLPDDGAGPQAGLTD